MVRETEFLENPLHSYHDRHKLRPRGCLQRERGREVSKIFEDVLQERSEIG